MEYREFMRLFEPVQKNIFFLILSIVRNNDDAEDVFQDTALKGCIHFQKLRSYDKFNAWISRIAVTTAYDFVRRRRRTVDIDAVTLPHYDTYNEDDDRLREAMLKLDESERTIVVLKAVQGLHHKEISQIVHRPENTVRTVYARAIKKLADMLSE